MVNQEMGKNNARARSQEEKVALAICFCLIVVEVVLLLNIGAEDRRTTYGVEIVSCTWSDYNALFTVTNTRTGGLTIVEVIVNGEYATMDPPRVELYPGGQATMTVLRTGGFISGVTYEFRFITNRGNSFAYTAIAP